jgi:hypothetical protein
VNCLTERGLSFQLGESEPGGVLTAAGQESGLVFSSVLQILGAVIAEVVEG